MVAKLYYGNHFSSEMLDPNIREKVKIESFCLERICSNHFSYVGCGFLGYQEVLCPEGSIHLNKGEVLYVCYVDENLLNDSTPLSMALTDYGMKIYLPR